MAGRPARFVSVAHSTPGRLRLRLAWLHRSPGEAPAIADRISALDGMEEVEIRPYTGSVLCRFDRTRLGERRIVEEVCAATGAKRAEAGEPGDAEVGRLAHVAHSEGSGLARAAAVFVKGLDAEVLEATAGRLDLAGAAALGFFSLSVLSLLTSRRLSLPTWSDLAWRAYTIFTREERRAIDRTPHPLV